MDSVDVYKKSIMANGLMLNDVEFNMLMGIYQKASDKVLEIIDGVAIEYNNMFNRKIMNHRIARIKEKKSIVNKMKKKNLELSYENLVDNIHDIAGVRVICHKKNDVYTLANIIEKIPNWNLICAKDYIKNPKKSGYSGYHMIVEVPVKIRDFDVNKQSAIGTNIDTKIANDINENMIENFQNWKLKDKAFVKVEIQIRTMAMDFWATNEHKMKYKTNKKLSFWDSKRLIIYAKLINAIDNRFDRIGKKQFV